MPFKEIIIILVVLFYIGGLYQAIAPDKWLKIPTGLITLYKISFFSLFWISIFVMAKNDPEQALITASICIAIYYFINLTSKSPSKSLNKDHDRF